MILYDVPRHNHVKILDSEDDEVYYFDHIDGMYSYCLNSKKEIVHLAAFTEVEIVN